MWSWALIVGNITYESQRLSDSGGRFEERPQELPFDCNFDNLSVERVCTRPKHNDKYGAILSASLSLNGALLTNIDSNLQLWRIEHDYQGGSKAKLTKDGVVVGLFYLDVLDEMPNTKELFCLRI